MNPLEIRFYMSSCVYNPRPKVFCICKFYTVTNYHLLRYIDLFYFCLIRSSSLFSDPTVGLLEIVNYEPISSYSNSPKTLPYKSLVLFFIYLYHDTFNSPIFKFLSPLTVETVYTNPL